MRHREVIARITNEVMRRGRLDEAGVVAILAEFFVTSVSVQPVSSILARVRAVFFDVQDGRAR